MTKIAVFESADASGLPDLLDAADGWCELVVVNAGPQPWTADEREGLADLGEVVDAAGRDAASVAAELAALDVEGVVTLEDEWIPLVAAVAARLDLPYHDEATAEAVTHKDVQRATSPAPASACGPWRSPTRPGWPPRWPRSVSPRC